MRSHLPGCCARLADWRGVVVSGSLYQWHGKPGWSLPICEHIMSAFQVIAFAIVLGAFMQRLAGRDESAMGLLPLERRGDGSGAT